MGKVKNVKEPGNLTFCKFFAWVSRDVSRVIQIVVMGAITVYATSALHMNVALVGTLLMATKLVDGVTDLIAGYIVDNTKTKWGKGRPYELFVLGLWFFTWLCFSVPESFSTVVKCIWIVIAYTVAQSICLTFLNSNATVYMVRSFKNEKDYVTLASWGGMVTIVGVIIFNIIFPMLEAKIMYDAAGWSRMIAMLAIPLTIIGIMRFVFIKEVVDVDAAVGGGDRVTLKDMLTVIKSNKYIWIVSLIYLFAALFSSIGAITYYCIVTFGDTAMAGTLSIFNIIPMVTMAFYPLLMKKLSVKQLIMIMLLFNIPGGILYYIANGSFGMLALATAFTGIASLPLNYMGNLMVIECATYNEYCGLQRMEGTLNSITGFANKIGGALASFIVGVMLAMGGYDGSLGVNESASAKSMITFMTGGMPIIMTVVLIVSLWFYTLDKHKEEYEAVIMERREAAEKGKA